MIDTWESSTKNLALLQGSDSEAIHQDVDAQKARVPLRRHGKIITAPEYFEPRPWKPHYDAKPPGAILPDEPDVPDHDIKDPIRHLVLTTQPQHAVPNLLSIRHRLAPDSSILFATPGLGVIEDVNLEVFPDRATRPHYLGGHSTHYIQRPDFDNPRGQLLQLQLLHAHQGCLYITPHALYNPNIMETLANPPPTELPPSAEYLLNSLINSRRLTVSTMSSLDLHMMQLQRLAINSVIKPIAAMMDATHSASLFNYSISRVQRLLIAEISLVLRSLPEIRGHPLVESKFSPSVLETQVVKSLWRRFREINVTLESMRKGTITDIDYFNGYVVKRGEDIGLRCFMNYGFQQMVTAKTNMINMEIHEQIPFDGQLPNEEPEEDL